MLAPTAMPICEVWERPVEEDAEEGEAVSELTAGDGDMAPAFNELDALAEVV